MEKSVNDLLHKARGERFRRDQNVRKDRVRHPNHAIHLPTRSLPPHLLTSSESEERAPPSAPSIQVSNTAGPVPKSWRRTTKEVQDKGSPRWRADALSLVLSGLQANLTSIPSLAELCMKVLLDALSEPEDFEKVLLPLLPPHLRFVLHRYTAVHSPLSTQRLNALMGESGHINGELIVVGPNASLCMDGVSLKPPNRQIPVESSQGWEAEDPFVDSFELQTLALLSTDFSLLAILSLPRSLTRLALVDVPTPPPLSKLPVLCPSIQTLDLSFNSWLASPDRSRAFLGTINWDGWNDLNVLGLRGYYSVHQETLDQVNKNRWVDVQIFL